jgi:hypothetical protein
MPDMLKMKDLFAPTVVKKKRKKYKPRERKLPPSKTDWWREHGSWVERHNIVSK